MHRERVRDCRFLVPDDDAAARSVKVPRPAANPTPSFDEPIPSSGLQLRRRQQRVVVCSPLATPKPPIPPEQERRAPMPTLPGLGTREAQPTLPDWTTPPPPAVRSRVHAIRDLDVEESDQLRREAARLSLSFEWDIE